jgi:TolB-like protein/Flp pilus assembly protein TadD
MAANLPFLMPVAIDDTDEADDRVPDRFHEVQWTRLPGGHTPAAFVERVSSLLSQPPSAPRKVSSASAASSAAARTAVAPQGTPSARLRASTLWLVVAVAFVLGAGYVAWDRFVPATRPAADHQSAAPTAESAAASSAIPEKSIAVLPFVDMSEKKDQEYLSDGLSEELINLLAQVRDLKVPARTSSFYFKGKQTTIAEIAKTLGVAHVLEGSVRKAGNTVRITAQMIRVSDGYHIWSEIYDRDLKDIFRLQDEIAAKVVQALKATLFVGVADDQRSTTNLDAYALTLQGRLMMARGAESDMRQAISTLERAVALEPDYAPAWVDLSSAYFAIYDFGYARRNETLPKARAAAEKALKIAPAFGAAHQALGWAKLYSDFDWAGASSEFDAARDADPASPHPDWLRFYSGCLSGPCYEQFMQELSHEIDRDPVNALRWADRGNAHYRAGDFEAAEHDFRRVLDLSPNLGPPRFNLVHTLILRHDLAGALSTAQSAPDGAWRDAALALAYDAAGRRPEADRLLQGSLTRGSFASPYLIARIYAIRGDRGAALDWLETAYRDGDHYMTWLKVDPAMKVLTEESRFKALQLKMKFPKVRETGKIGRREWAADVICAAVRLLLLERGVLTGHAQPLAIRHLHPGIGEAI